MPLHEWTERPGWEGVHHVWITELLRWIKPRLPAGYRTYIGTAPTLAIGAPAEKPDVAVHGWPQEGQPEQPTAGEAAVNGTEPTEPDVQVAVAMLQQDTALFVERAGRLVAAVELISPRNKDRPVARTTYLARYLGYLLRGVNLTLVDLHRRPLTFSFADQIAEALQIKEPALPAPFAISYGVGEPAATGGSILSIWRRPLKVGSSLPILDLPLTVECAVPIDLEQTSMRAAADAYLT